VREKCYEGRVIDEPMDGLTLGSGSPPLLVSDMKSREACTWGESWPVFPPQRLNKCGLRHFDMALTDPLQWVVIAIVAIVFLMYGPKKIPELARSIGLARKEFNDASKNPLSSDTSETPAPAATAAPAPQTGDALLDTAKKLGISTEGKTRDEISSEIVSKAASK